MTLEFQHWLSVEAGQYDQAQVLINGVVVWEYPFAVNLVDTPASRAAWTRAPSSA